MARAPQRTTSSLRSEFSALTVQHCSVDLNYGAPYTYQQVCQKIPAFDTCIDSKCRLTEHLQGLGGDASDPEDMDSFVGSIMKQLLSKSVLYQSMQVGAS